MMKLPNSFRGFTLLEILIALFVFSILSLVVASTLRSVIDSEAGTAKSAERLREVQLALLVLSRDIEQALPRSITNSLGEEEAALKGEPQGFSLTHGGFANPNSTLLRSNLQRSRYYFEESSLWRGVWQVLDQASNSKPGRRLLLNKVSELSFEYVDERGRPHVFWPPENQSKEFLPRAIRMHLTLADWGKIIQVYVIAAEQPKIKNPTPPPKS